MQKILGFLFITIAFLITGCEYDYNVGLDYKPQIVINSIINPDSTIKVNLFWSKELGSKEDYKRVVDFSARIYENDSIVFEAEDLKDSIKTTYYPKEGKGYRLEVNVPEYGIVKAKTSIPMAPTAEIKYNGMTPATWGEDYRHFEINKISSETKVRAIIARALGFYDNGTVKISHSLYVNNPFCDQFNVWFDNEEGTTSHSGSIRIPYKNLELASPLIFYINNFSTYSDKFYKGTDEWGFPIYEYDTHTPISIAVEMIAPSDEYDKYYKSTDLQWVYGDVGIPIFNVIIPAHSNIENGLGIFAGYSYNTFKVEIEQDED